MLTLYFCPGACSLASHTLLEELGEPYQAERVDLAKTADPADPYHRIQWKGAVPALRLDDGQILTENGAILAYLADRKPEAGLMGGQAPLERARVAEWIGFVNSDVHGAFGPLFRAAAFHPDPAVHEGVQQAARERVTTMLGEIERRLSGREWCNGERFSAADPYVYVIWRWASAMGFPLDGYPAYRAFAARMQARPAVQRALAQEGLEPV